MYIERTITQTIIQAIKPGKVVVLYGARQVGKSTLISHICQQLNFTTFQTSADDIEVRTILSSQRTKELQNMVGNNQLIFIDEAQRVENIGLNLKIIIDSMPHVRIIVTGSSSLELAARINEPLTGRKETFHLGPISFAELAAHSSLFEARQQLQLLMRYGSYPALLSLSGDQEKRAYLKNLLNDYLYRDILNLGLVEKPAKLQQLLKLLAYQVGSEASLSELGAQLQLDSKSVARYISLLEQSFVLFRLGGYSTNLRKEVSKKQKYFFWDVGVRNALIDRFEALELRQDTGALWENFLIIEHRKRDYPNFEWIDDYFWRTKAGSEVDYIEVKDGRPQAFEVKWGGTRRPSAAAWRNNYPNAPFTLINQDNFPDFIV